jgi:hypothetical protein
VSQHRHRLGARLSAPGSEHDAISGGDPDRWRTANFQLANGLPNFFLRQALQFDKFAW